MLGFNADFSVFYFDTGIRSWGGILNWVGILNEVAHMFWINWKNPESEVWF